MRMLKLLPVVFFAIALTACGKKDAPDASGSPVTNAPAPSVPTPYPVTGDFNLNCQARGGQPYGSFCVYSVGGSANTVQAWPGYWGYTSVGNVQSGQGVVLNASGDVEVKVGGTVIPHNSKNGNVSGSVTIKTSGQFSYQLWIVRCENTSFQAVSCAGF